MQEPFAEIDRLVSSARATFVDMDQPYPGKNRTLLIGISVLLTASVCVWWLVQNAARTRTHTDHFPEKVNLALRRTAHYLLTEMGDSSSTITPVQQLDANSWELQIERHFNYDRLPELLQQSLEVHGIRSNYDVAVLKCSDNTLQLGYNFWDFRKNNSAPCGGREMEQGCYNLQVHFIRPETGIAAGNGTLVWLLAACGLLTGIFLTTRYRRKQVPSPDIQTAETDHLLLFGQSKFDLANQRLISGNQAHRLTYREAKLLQLFASHPNRLLERDFILQSVWADEGILVGRSVDVFVSRLRKLLRDDPTVRLVAVHGVGYRLETDV